MLSAHQVNTMRQIVTVAHNAGTFRNDTETDAAMKLLGNLNRVMQPLDDNADVTEDSLSVLKREDLFCLRYIVDMHAKRIGYKEEELANIHGVVETVNSILSASPSRQPDAAASDPASPPPDCP